MKNLTRIGTLVVLTLVTASLVTATQTTGDSWSLEKVLPDDTLFYMTLPNTADVHEALKKTALYKLSQDEEVREFFKPIAAKKDAAVKLIDAQLSGFGGLTIEKITDLLKNSTLSVAVLPFSPPGQPSVVFCFSPREKADEFSTALASLKDGIKNHDSSVQETKHDYKGKSYIQFGKEGRDHTLCYTILEKNFVFSNSQDGIEEIIANTVEAPRKSLHAAASFKAVRDKISKDRKEALFAFINIKELLTLVTDQIDDADMEALGLKGVQSIGASLTFQGEDVRETYFLHTTGEKKGLVKLASWKPLSRRSLSTVPANAFAVVAANLDVQEFLRTMPELLKLGGGIATSPVRKQIKEFAEKTRDLWASLGTEVTVFAATPEAGGIVPEFVVSVDVKDEAQFKAALDTVTTKAKWETLNYKGTTVTYTYIKSHGPREAVSVPMSYMIHNKVLYFSLSPQTLKRQINRLQETRFQSLADDPGFKRISGSIPSDAGMIVYLDTPTVVTTLYNTFLPFADFARHKIKKESQGLIQPAKLPLGETLGKYLHDSAYSLTSDPEGIRVESLNWPSGASLVLMLFMILA